MATGRETRRNSEPRRAETKLLAAASASQRRRPVFFSLSLRRHRGSRLSVNSHETNTVLLQHSYGRVKIKNFTAPLVLLSPPGERVVSLSLSLSRRVSKNFLGIFI